MTNRPLLVIGNRNYSSWSLRPWILAQHLGIQLDVHRIALDTPTFQAEALAFTPTAKVPVLIHGDLVIPESIAIMEYLSELANARGWPQDVGMRARARAIAAEMHGGFQALRGSFPMNIRAVGRQVATNPGLIRDITRMDAILAIADTHNAEAPWLFGQYSIADAMLLPVAFRFQTYGLHLLSDRSRRYVEWAIRDPMAEEWIRLAQAETEVLSTEEIGR